MDFDSFIQLLFAALLGAGGFWMFHLRKVGSYTALVNDIMRKAELEADALRRNTELVIKQSQLEQQRKIEKEEERCKQREDKLEARMHLLEKKLSEADKKEQALTSRSARLEESERRATEREESLAKQLERAAGLSAQEARALLLDRLTQEVQAEAAQSLRKIRREAEEDAERQAQTIIATAINRLAISCVAEHSINTVAIPSDEMKGRIIGREGRNIKALEQATGVTLILDDSPGVVVISGLDPIRIYIAKTALSELLADGRIHPSRIEEIVEKVSANVEKQIKKYGHDAALQVGAVNLHPELMTLLGKLKFRYSYGQNILEHSLEVSHLMGIMAAELGVNESLARRIGLLHDIGKAVSREVEGSHAKIGHDFALKYGEKAEVANGIGCHHHEMDPMTIEGGLCNIADTISASRLGAREASGEHTRRRLEKLEELACQFAGVEKAYVVQAGREVRVIVTPDLIDDEEARKLANDLTRRIEKELSYPGKIKITVIREKRITAYAL